MVFWTSNHAKKRLMKLKTFKTLWGHQGSISEACQQAIEAGFSGIEGRAPEHNTIQSQWNETIKANHCEYIAEIVTGGNYVPDRNWTIEQHLLDMENQIQASLALNPLFATCITGCDAWREPESLAFFAKAIELGKRYGIPLSFETHRSRSLFNPWITERIVSNLPEIKLTLDMSHWCVVAEQQMDTEMNIMKRIAANVYHIHARVGYDQGPQVPDPAAPEYEHALHTHEAIWKVMWTEQQKAGRDVSTITPEFGPDGYCHVQPYTQQPVADIWKINQWMNQREEQLFSQFQNQTS